MFIVMNPKSGEGWQSLQECMEIRVGNSSFGRIVEAEERLKMQKFELYMKFESASESSHKGKVLSAEN